MTNPILTILGAVVLTLLALQPTHAEEVVAAELLLGSDGSIKIDEMRDGVTYSKTGVSVSAEALLYRKSLILNAYERPNTPLIASWGKEFLEKPSFFFLKVVEKGDMTIVYQESEGIIIVRPSNPNEVADRDILDLFIIFIGISMVFMTAAMRLAFIKSDKYTIFGGLVFTASMTSFIAAAWYFYVPMFGYGIISSIFIVMIILFTCSGGGLISLLMIGSFDEAVIENREGKDKDMELEYKYTIKFAIVYYILLISSVLVYYFFYFT